MCKIHTLLFFFILCIGCKKETIVEEQTAYVSVVNTVAGERRLAVYVDTTFQTGLSYREFYRNLPLTAGQHTLSIRDSLRVRTFISIGPEEFLRNTTSTIVVYDTLDPVNTTVRAIRLSDDLTLPPNGFVKVRFVHTAPLTNPVDVTFLRTSVNPPDSVTLSSKQYIGSTINVETLSAFIDIPLGDYTLKIKRAATQDTIMKTIKLLVSNLAGSAGISGITTFYLTGGVQGDSLRVLSFRHYP